MEILLISPPKRCRSSERGSSKKSTPGASLFGFVVWLAGCLLVCVLTSAQLCYISSNFFFPGDDRILSLPMQSSHQNCLLCCKIECSFKTENKKIHSFTFLFIFRTLDSDIHDPVNKYFFLLGRIKCDHIMRKVYSKDKNISKSYSIIE